jgi:hypothetical protein
MSSFSSILRTCSLVFSWRLRSWSNVNASTARVAVMAPSISVLDTTPVTINMLITMEMMSATIVSAFLISQRNRFFIRNIPSSKSYSEELTIADAKFR